MAIRYIHKNKEGQWAISNSKTGKALRNASTQKEAIALAGSMKSTESIMIKRSSGWGPATGWDQQVADLTKSKTTKKAEHKKPAAKKATTKKAPAKKAAAKKEEVKKAPAKKAAAKKTTAKKATAKKAAPKKAAAKKAAPKKAAAKKTTAKKATTKKVAAKKVEVKKATPAKSNEKKVQPAAKTTKVKAKSKKAPVVNPVVKSKGTKKQKLEEVNVEVMEPVVTNIDNTGQEMTKTMPGWLAFLIGLFVISAVVATAFLIGYYAL